MGPCGELACQNPVKICEFRKVAIMSAKASSQFPDSLDGIEIGTVWWKEEKSPEAPVVMEPGPELSGMVPSDERDDKARRAPSYF